MRSRHLTAATLAAMAAALAALTVLATGGPDGSGRPHPTPGPAASSRPRVAPVPADSDLDAIRDIFRFGGANGPARPVTAPAPDRTGADARAATEPRGARLVGLVRRGDRLRAALVLEGEVVLLGEGESAFGQTAVEVSEEGVVLRDPGGDEETLPLEPPPGPR